MGIRIEHQPSPGVVGMAAYAAGRGSAEERQRKQRLALYARQQEMRFGRQMQLERLGIQARVRHGLQQAGFKHDAGLQEERLEAEGAMRQAGYDEYGRRQEAGFEEQRKRDAREEQIRDAERERDRRAKAMGDREERVVSDRNEGKISGLLDEIEDIQKSNDYSKEDRQSAIDDLERQIQDIYDDSPKKPTRQERIDESNEGQGLPEWMRKLPWNIDEDGNKSLPSGFKMPDSPEATQQKQEQDQAKAEHDESIHQWEAADKDWLYKDAERGRYAKYLQGLEENEGLSRSEVMAKVDAEFGGPLGPRPGRPARPAPGGQQAGGQEAGGQGGQREVYDPDTGVVSSPPVMMGYDPNAPIPPPPSSDGVEFDGVEFAAQIPGQQGQPLPTDTAPLVEPPPGGSYSDQYPLPQQPGPQGTPPAPQGGGLYDKPTLDLGDIGTTAEARAMAEDTAALREGVQPPSKGQRGKPVARQGGPRRRQGESDAAFSQRGEKIRRVSALKQKAKDGGTLTPEEVAELNQLKNSLRRKNR